jgi:hypothetical protein
MSRFHRFDAVWMPTVLLLDAAGKERVRLEGYVSNNDFMAALKNGLGRIAFVQKKYADAQRWYGDVLAQHGDSHFAPEAMYWRAVEQYSATHDHAVLGKAAEELRFNSVTTLFVGLERLFRLFPSFVFRLLVEPVLCDSILQDCQ